MRQIVKAQADREAHLRAAIRKALIYPFVLAVSVCAMLLVLAAVLTR